MRICRAYQVPHSAFLSWSKDDRDKATWEYIRSAQTCPSCHTREAEWAEAEGGDRDAYRTEPVRCRGCEVMETARAQLDEKKTGKGVQVRLVRSGRR